jgi:predicted nucleotidyltransferase
MWFRRIRDGRHPSKRGSYVKVVVTGAVLASRVTVRTRVFGSVARGDDRTHSDIDLLVDMDPDRSLLDVVGLGQDLEELLDRRVDVLTGASLHPALRDRILAESREL